MKKIKKLHSLVVSILLFLILGIGAVMMMFPDASGSIIGYRMYTILSDSMEPSIPVDSLVIVRSLQNGEQPLQTDVITFEADRFGQPIILTHIYDKSELVDGVMYYRTHPFGEDTYDPYNVPYENIKGVYVYHIPHIGKFMLFIGSPYGSCLLVVSAFIIFLYQYANEHFDLDEEISLSHSRHRRKYHEHEAILVKHLKLNVENDHAIVSGELLNATSIAVYKVKAKLIFLDMDDNIVFTKQAFLIQRDALGVHEHRKWSYECMYDSNIKDVYIEILEAKKVLRKNHNTFRC